MYDEERNSKANLPFYGYDEYTGQPIYGTPQAQRTYATPQAPQPACAAANEQSQNAGAKYTCTRTTAPGQVETERVLPHFQPDTPTMNAPPYRQTGSTTEQFHHAPPQYEAAPCSSTHRDRTPQGTTAHRSRQSTKKRGRKVAKAFAAIGLVAVISAGSVAGYVGITGAGTGSNKTSTAAQLPATTDYTMVTTSGQTLTIPQVASKCSPSVVGIIATTYTQSSGMYGNFGGSQGFFGGSGSSNGGTIASESQGSGFVLKADGTIITNAHVVEGASELVVYTQDGQQYSATLVGMDSEHDIAVIKADATDLTAIEIGDSNAVVVGETVVSIGNPMGEEFAGTVTTGIVSAVDRDVQIENLAMSLIQTDAAISPGNSGGPLLNMSGQVIGVVSSKVVSTGAEGIGFAIPITDAMEIVNNILSNSANT